jgi:virginiamycin A acetyltransferase
MGVIGGIFSKLGRMLRGNPSSGRNPHFDPTVTISASSIDENAVIGSYSYIDSSTIQGNVTVGDHSAVVQAVISGNVRIGRYTSFNGPVSDIVTKIHDVSIGNFCSIARNCTIQEFNHITDRCTSYYIFRNLLDAKDRQEFIWSGSEDKDITSNGPVKIGNDVWIGAQCIILSGVTIGDGAVIAANSTVTKDIPPYAIAGGTPAKPLKYRFEQPIIEALLKLSWWNWDDETIRSNRDFFERPMTMEKLSKVKLP